MRHYDYIFAGGGLAAMMVLMRLRDNGMLKGKSVLIIDPDPRTGNDRTWCFWEPFGGEFDAIAHRQWDRMLFKDRNASLEMDLSPYLYKMVRGDDFFHFARAKLSGTNIQHLTANVISFQDTGQGAEVMTPEEKFGCGMLFNSIFDEDEVLQSKYRYLRQHFVGWTVETQNPVFDPQMALFMDFSVNQKGNTRFMYVLPESNNKALVEYTLFSPNLLPQSHYEDEIRNYLEKMGAGKFQIIDREQGSIPMTVYPFHQKNTKHIAFIGSAGGWTKASTGFTFTNTQRKAGQLAKALRLGKSPATLRPNTKFNFYDALLIEALYGENEKGSKIFSSMFRRGEPTKILRFLDEDTTLTEDLGIIMRCPKRIFLRALWRHINR